MNEQTHEADPRTEEADTLVDLFAWAADATDKLTELDPQASDLGPDYVCRLMASLIKRDSAFKAELRTVLNARLAEDRQLSEIALDDETIMTRALLRAVGRRW